MRMLTPLLIILIVLALAVTVAASLPPYPPTGDRVRPLVGGYQIEMWKEIRFWPDQSPGPCTLGFPVYRVVDGAYGIVTAGHCNEWDKDGWIYDWVMHQPVKDGDNNEIDPVEATACVVDATLVFYSNVYPGILHIYSDGSYETLEVTDWISWSEVPNYIYSVAFYKTGRTSGTTSTYLAGYESSFQSVLYPCKVYKALFFHAVFAYPGDSGAPAYEKLGGHAVLLGYIVANTDEWDGTLRTMALNVENLWDAFGVKPYVCWWC